MKNYKWFPVMRDGKMCIYIEYNDKTDDILFYDKWDSYLRQHYMDYKYHDTIDKHNKQQIELIKLQYNKFKKRQINIERKEKLEKINKLI